LRVYSPPSRIGASYEDDVQQQAGIFPFSVAEVGYRMKYAIGMLDLAPFEILGDPLFSKRYCSQVIIPLIGMLEAEKRLRITLTATGSAIEYLAESHPLVLKKIRALIEEGRIELLCSAYTNSDWPVFPSSDLRRSHCVSDAILRRHGLPLSRTMVAQQNPYWPAMSSFQHEFDVFLVRDTFLRGRNAARGFPQMARVGNALLVVAANNLLHDMAGYLVSQKETSAMGLFTERRLENAVETWTHSDPLFVDVSIGEDNWHWFHSAGAHHFTTGVGLRSGESFFCDPEWMLTVQRFFGKKLSEGLSFRLVSELTRAAGTQLQTLPDLGDARWGLDAGTNHAYWLEAPEQRLRAVLSWTSLSWRSRTALREAEAAVERTVGNQRPEALRGEIESLWRSQLWTQVSPVVSRATLPCEVEFIREHAERVMSTTAELSFRLESSGSPQNAVLPWDDGIQPGEPEVALVETELINGDGSVKWFSRGNGIHRCEACFVAEESTCGIGFKLSSRDIDFSSCGYESEVANVPLSSFDEGGDILTSPTGLYGLGAGIYLIRHNRNLSVGAQVGTAESYLRFIVDFAPEGRLFEWPFTIVKGSASTAIAMAKRINTI
jgi:hypothetical protein